MPLKKLTLKQRIACRTKKELIPIAREKGITPGKLRKDQLVNRIFNKTTKKKKKIEFVYPKK